MFSLCQKPGSAKSRSSTRLDIPESPHCVCPYQQKNANLAELVPPNDLGDSNRPVVSLLIDLLQSQRLECVLNAAGTIGSLAGLDEGRKWLISSIPDTEKFFNIIHHLLQSENRLVVSNTALILARLVLAEEGTNFILSSEINVIILQQMVDLIGPCPSGCGTNCSFAIGRLFEVELGRSLLFEQCCLTNLGVGLAAMLAVCFKPTTDLSQCKDACFCLAAIASQADGNRWLAGNTQFLFGDQGRFGEVGDAVDSGGGGAVEVLLSENTTVTARMSTMTTIATSGGESTTSIPVGALASILHLIELGHPETAWFAAVVLRTFSSHVDGYKVLRNNRRVWRTIKNNPSGGSPKEVSEELAILREFLSPLQAPEQPSVQSYGDDTICVTWEEAHRELPLPIINEVYLTAKGAAPRLVYKGPHNSAEISGLSRKEKYSVKVRQLTEIEASPFSEENTFRLALPDETESRLAPAAGVSEDDGGSVIGTPEEMQATPPAQMQVTAAFNGRRGPSKPTVMAVGKTEAVVSWEPPEYPLIGGLRRYEVYVNESEEPIYSGNQTFCHFRGLQSGAHYHFKVMMVSANDRSGHTESISRRHEGRRQAVNLSSGREAAPASRAGRPQPVSLPATFKPYRCSRTGNDMENKTDVGNSQSIRRTSGDAVGNAASLGSQKKKRGRMRDPQSLLSTAATTRERLPRVEQSSMAVQTFTKQRHAKSKKPRRRRNNPTMPQPTCNSPESAVAAVPHDDDDDERGDEVEDDDTLQPLPHFCCCCEDDGEEGSGVHLCPGNGAGGGSLAERTIDSVCDTFDTEAVAFSMVNRFSARGHAVAKAKSTPKKPSKPSRPRRQASTAAAKSTSDNGGGGANGSRPMSSGPAGRRRSSVRPCPAFRVNSRGERVAVSQGDVGCSAARLVKPPLATVSNGQHHHRGSSKISRAQHIIATVSLDPWHVATSTDSNNSYGESVAAIEELQQGDEEGEEEEEEEAKRKLLPRVKSASNHNAERPTRQRPRPLSFRRRKATPNFCVSELCDYRWPD